MKRCIFNPQTYTLYWRTGPQSRTEGVSGVWFVCFQGAVDRCVWELPSEQTHDSLENFIAHLFQGTPQNPQGGAGNHLLWGWMPGIFWFVCCRGDGMTDKPKKIDWWMKHIFQVFFQLWRISEFIKILKQPKSMDGNTIIYFYNLDIA